MPKPMGFLDFLTVDYTQTGDPQLALNAKKRKRDSGETTSEALSLKQLKRKHKRHIDAFNKNNKDLPKKVEDELFKWAMDNDGIGDDPDDFDAWLMQNIEEDVDEALTLQQRQKRARLMKKLAPRIKLAKAKAAKKVASPDKLKSRAVKQARMLLFKKLTKDTPKAELSFARRQEIEKKLAKKKAVIQKIAKKLFPKVRAAELEKKRGKKSD